MSQTSPAPAPSFDAGPLSWVIGEIRDALDRSLAALRDAAGRAPQARPTLLLHAKSHLHQAHGALQMVDVGGAGLLAEAAERAIDGFKEGTLALDDAALAALADACGALVDYLAELVAGSAPQPLRLFPYYRALQELLKAERVHPGALLAPDLDTAVLPPAPAGPAPDLAASRARFEKALLPFLRSQDETARRAHAQEMHAALAPIAQGQADPVAYASWLALPAVAELAAHGQLAGDIYLKQLFGQVNLQLRRLAQGHAELPEALLRDALFFVAAAPTPTADARLLRAAWRLEGQVPADYLERRYGRVDPGALQDARAALVETKQGWDRIATDGADGDRADGDFDAALSRLAGASEKLGAPALAHLLRELGEAANRAMAGGRNPQFSLEMAEAMLFVEHGLDQVRQLPEDFGQHAELVGQRLLALAQGEAPPDAPHWQGELAHELQGHTVAVLAGELRAGLRQVEKLVEEYHADPARTATLDQADPLLHQLQGALAILDQDEAGRAAAHVRAALAGLAAGATAGDERAATLENVAHNIGALGFFVDALAQNVDGARRRFGFDAHAGLFRERPPEAQPAAALPPAPSDDALPAEPQPAAAQPPQPAPGPEPAAAPGGDAVEAELLEIFIDEAREVLGTVGGLLPAAGERPADQDTLTRLRRAFHTLKGSSRMVGLERFALAAAAVEKTMNLWLAEARAATPDLLAMLADAHAALAAWVEELAGGGQSGRDGAELVAAAERVREGGAHAPQPQPQLEPEPESEPEPEPGPEAEAEAVRAAAPDNIVPFPVGEDKVKRIGELEIPLPLYGIYVDETAELVRVLGEDFAAWRAAPGRAATPQALAAAHTLGGTSATVGFHALQEIAVALEAALEVAAPPLRDDEFALLDEALERVRIMLQVFALGEPAPAQPELLARLGALRDALARRHADAVLDGAEPELAQRLDALFAAAYESILADPPLGSLAALPVATELAPRAAQERVPDPAVSEVDDLFDAYFDAPPPPALAAPAPAPDDAPDGDVPSAQAQPAPEPVAQAEPEPVPVAEAEAEPAPESEPALATEPVFADELDPDLLPVFMEEAADLLPQIGNGLRQWQQEPADAGVAHGLLRALHTVKGSARMAGAMRLGQHVHALETQVENMLHAGTTSPVAFDELLANYDQAQLLFEQLQQPAPPAAAAPAAQRLPATPPAPAAPAPLVRVRADILDRLVNQAGEVSIARSRLETQVGTLKGALSDFSDNLARLRRQLREVEMQAESQIASRLSIAGEREFDPLEFDRFTRLQELTRMMAESVDDVASFQDGMVRAVDSAHTELAAQSRLTRELQRDLMRVRMVPFASLSERLFRVARQTAKETDKRVNLDIRGGAVEIDRSVLERMAAPFEHLLRNAIVHGIEERAARAAAGKPETGELLVQVSQQGNEVEIRFADDGAGLDLERIRASARAAGLLAEGEDVADRDAAELVFEPGLSTATTLSELAGRGVGMDVVRSEARALGGRVDVASEAGRGAAFTIHLPLTLAVTQVVLVASGARTHALPAVLVEQVLQVRAADLRAARAAGTFDVQGEALPLHYLPDLLREPGAAGGAGGPRSSPVMILRNGGARIALEVDEVLGNREAVVKNIGPQLARMPGVAGATVLGSGEIVLILNPVLLPGANVRRPGAPGADADAAVHPAPPRIATVLVVDDSLTVRKVTQRLLEREGYRVLLAKDGVDALEQMQDARPDLMLVDIEMPRMDGFDLARHVRGDAATRTLPIIMITSRTADKHRNYALGLGVDAYFGKPFQEEALLAAIAALLA
ncbi:Hpt domain-containing protein [uncultured Massilia sp.]|uniref:hybrid sensor histidine kinase/response regulator n=1 Tax=uncultured Massilia sp. TaxID=169973 RepID=UPI0025F13F31|nr:Hpt domain-containing protein [uncultured Massilia sp.]